MCVDCETCIVLENLQHASAYYALKAFSEIRDFECGHSIKWLRLEKMFMQYYKDIDFSQTRRELPENLRPYLDAFVNVSTPLEILNAFKHNEDLDVDTHLNILRRIVFVVESQICIILECIAKS